MIREKPIYLKEFAGDLYKKIDLFAEPNEVLVGYLLWKATPEHIAKYVKNLQSLINIHGELEKVLYVLPRDLLMKIIKRIPAKKIKDKKTHVKKTTKKVTKKTTVKK